MFLDDVDGLGWILWLRLISPVARGMYPTSQVGELFQLCSRGSVNEPITPLLNKYLQPDLKLDGGIDCTLCWSARYSDRSIGDDVLDLELKIS